MVSEQLPSEQTNRWVAQKQEGYAKFGATPGQQAAWGDYDRKRYTSFLEQQAAAKGKPSTAVYDEPVDPAPMTNPAPRLRPIGAPAKPIEGFDPRLQTPQANYAAAVGTLPSTGGWLAFKRGAMGMYPVPQVDAIPEPAPAARVPDATGPKTNKKGRVVLDLGKAGEPTGWSEDGQVVDRFGKKLGYTAQQGDVRTADRQPGDFTLQDRDFDAVKRFEGIYGPHLQELEDNSGKFPAGYFKNMSAEEKQNIIKGVQALQQIKRGTRT